MKRYLTIFICATTVALLGSCTYQQKVCPAYQSSYIYDKDALRQKFSYFNQDSTPKVFAASKSKYLIIEPVSYRKKVQALKTIEQKPWPVVVPDSLQAGYTKEGSLTERNVYDSTAVIRIDTLAAPSAKDSVYQITKERELLLLKYNNQEKKYWVDTLGYNVEQDNYMWYLRHVLVLPDARLAMLQKSEEEKKSSKKADEKTERKKGGLKNLFKKKEKADTTAVEGFEGTTSATMLKGKKQKPAKKKKAKKEQKPAEKPLLPPKEDETEDDGF